jgi:plastocyanin
MADSPTPMSGTVIGFIPHQQSVAIFLNTGLSSGGVVNPSFMDDVRVMVRPDPGTNGGSHNPVVPAGMTVHVGDHVTYQTPYRDPSMQCGFFPSQVTADQGPMAAPASPMPAAPPVQTASLPPATAAPITSPAPAAATQGNVCLMVMPQSPTAFGNGVVMSFDDRAMSMARIQFTQAQTHGQIDPDYIDNQRVIVRLGSGELRVFLVPKTMQVHPGDRVTFQGIYRNMNLPCNYVPNLITADTGPTPQNAASSSATAAPPLVH